MGEWMSEQRVTTRLVSLREAYPEHILEQDMVRQLCAELFGDQPGLFERMRAVYASADVHTRHSCVPIEWYLQPHDWPDRMAVYREAALDLLEQAARAALDEAGHVADEVDQVVCVSTTGISTPSLEALLASRLGLRPDVVRLPIFGLGCAGGVSGLARADAMARSRPGSLVLFLVIELCGPTFRAQQRDKSNIVATALFADGAAAALLIADEGQDGTRFGRSAEHLWPDTEDIMGWRIEEDGLGILLSRDLPRFVEQNLGDVVDAFLASESAPPKGFILHPGGTRVLDALGKALEVDPVSIERARDVLRSHGNMSSVTVLAVLKRALAEGADGRHLLMAMGPGFTASLMMAELDGNV